MAGAAGNVLEALNMHVWPVTRKQGPRSSEYSINLFGHRCKILDVDAKLSSSSRYLFCSNELRRDLCPVEYVLCLETGNPESRSILITSQVVISTAFLRPALPLYKPAPWPTGGPFGIYSYTSLLPNSFQASAARRETSPAAHLAEKPHAEQPRPDANSRSLLHPTHTPCYCINLRSCLLRVGCNVSR